MESNITLVPVNMADYETTLIKTTSKEPHSCGGNDYSPVATSSEDLHASACFEDPMSDSATSLDRVRELNKSKATTLPTEILDGILESLLTFERPIEFAPAEFHKTQFFVKAMTPYQYEHVLRYRNHIRPALEALRVCKAWYKNGKRTYYSKNAFRFSSHYGWEALLQFLQLIGPGNRSLLRDITICHPAIAHKDTISWEQSGLFNYHLGPFGLTQPGDGKVVKWSYTVSTTLPGGVPGEPTWSHSTLLTKLLSAHPYHGTPYELEIFHAALSYLQSITELQSLCLLIYDDARLPAGEPSDVWKESEPFADHDINRVNWSSQPKLTVSLVNLVPRDHGFGKPVTLEATLRYDKVVAQSSDSSMRSYFGTTENAKAVFDQGRAQGWEVVEMRYASCGSYPVKAYHADETSVHESAEEVGSAVKEEDNMNENHLHNFDEKAGNAIGEEGTVNADPHREPAQGCSSGIEEEDSGNEDPLRGCAEGFGSFLEDPVDGHPHRDGICTLCTEVHRYHTHQNRMMFVESVQSMQRQFRQAEDWDWTYAPGLPRSVCVRCWLHHPSHTTLDLIPTCTCEDGGTYIAEDWSTDVYIVGGLEQPFFVDVAKKSGENVTWEELIR